MNEELIYQWKRRKLLGEMLLTQRRFYMKHGFRIKSRDDLVFHKLNREYEEAKAYFRTYAGIYGIKAIKEKSRYGALVASNILGQAMPGHKIEFDVSSKPTAERKSRERVKAESRYSAHPELKISVTMSWHNRVFRDFYGLDTKLIKSVLVLKAEPFRMPDRRFDFFRVIYYEFGADKHEHGFAVRSREFPKLIAFSKDQSKLVALGEKKIADLVTRELLT